MSDFDNMTTVSKVKNTYCRLYTSDFSILVKISQLKEKWRSIIDDKDPQNCGIFFELEYTVSRI